MMTDAKAPQYEGVPTDTLLPPKGVEVWVDHPAFSQCELLSKAVDAVGCEIALERLSGHSSAKLGPIDDWLNGRTPIPEKKLAMLLRMRERIAKIQGVPKPLPPIREK